MGALALDRTRARVWGGIAFFAALTALTARVMIPLPFTPVPVTLQVLAVLLAGLALGAWAGAASQLTYLTAIAAGLPLSAWGLGGSAAFHADRRPAHFTGLAVTKMDIPDSFPEIKICAGYKLEEKVRDRVPDTPRLAAKRRRFTPLAV